MGTVDLVAHRMELTYAGAMLLVESAIERATAMGEPQCIAVVDRGGNLVAFARMDGAKYLSVHTALTKAKAAASLGKPTWEVDEHVGVRLALASGGALTALKAGIPIRAADTVIGGIGVASGTAEDDMDVARYAVAAFEAALGAAPREPRGGDAAG